MPSSTLPSLALPLVTNLSPGPFLTQLQAAARDCHLDVLVSSELSPPRDRMGLFVWEAEPHDAIEPLTEEFAPRSGVLIRVATAPAVLTTSDFFTTWTPQISGGEMRAWIQAAVAHLQLKHEQQRLNLRLSQLKTRELVGTTPAMERVRQQIIAAAGQDWPVLIVGEAGTGRELAARMVHQASERGHRPCLRVDCRVMSAGMLHRELCGEERLGAEPVPGRLELCAGGTLFLKEVQELSLPCQELLAEILEAGHFSPLGSPRKITLDVRFCASAAASGFELASRKKLIPALAAYWSSPSIVTPPLRERKADLTQLVEHLLQDQSQRDGLPARRLLRETLEVLNSYDWPGNLSELQTVIQRACGASPATRLTPELISPWMGQGQSPENSLTLAEMERQLIEATFARFGGNRERTAQALQIGLRTLSGKLREYGYPPRGGPNSKREAAERRAA